MKVQEMIEINGQWFPHERDATPEEIEDMERQQAEEEARRRQDPPTEMEKLQAQVLYTAMLTDSIIEEES